jgi:hypothetical protein
VKLVYDKKTGKSKGFGFLYMNDPNSDAAVKDYAMANQNRVNLLNKSDVFIARNDHKRQNPIRNPTKKSHEDGVKVLRPSHFTNAAQPPTHASVGDRDASYHANNMYPPGAYGVHYDSRQTNSAQFPAMPFTFPQPYSMPPPPAHQNSYEVSTDPHFNAQVNPPRMQVPLHQAPPSTKIILENLPLVATPHTISAGLHQYSLNVTCCIMEYDPDPKASWCYAHLDMASPDAASRCVWLAENSSLEFQGRMLSASIDNSPKPNEADVRYQIANVVGPPLTMPPHNIVRHNQYPEQLPKPIGRNRRHMTNAPRTNFPRGGRGGGGHHRPRRRDRPY